jgi:Tfp pilus assembly protein PilF
MMIALGGCETTPQTEPEPEASVVPVFAPAAPGTLELAQRALADNRYNDSRKLLDRVLIGEPDNIEAQLLAAELYLAAGASEQAAMAFENLVELPEIAARANQGHGISLMLLGKRERGFESLRQAVEGDSTLWRAWNALGYYHDVERDWSEAAESYGKALEGRPKSALIYNNRGFSMLMQRRLEEAVDDFNRALKIDPDFEIARENLRLALAWEGKYIHAISGAAESDMARILNNVGYIAMMRGDYTNAEAYLLRAMEVDPTYNEAAARNLAYLKQVWDLAKAQSQTTAN